MALRWYTVVVDCHDPHSLSHWWAQTLDYQVSFESGDEVTITPRHADPHEIEDPRAWMTQAPGMVFVPVPEGKTVKNRLHIDLAPHRSQDRDAEIASLLERGATLADVGQGEDVSWTVLRDPEGNEFCVLSSRTS